MRVIVEKAYGRYSIGAVIPEMPGNQARALIARGLVREDVEDKAVPRGIGAAMSAGVDYLTRGVRADKPVARTSGRR